MNTRDTDVESARGGMEYFSPFPPPFMRAPEAQRTVYGVTIVAACAPLAAGILFFGWRAAAMAGLCVVSCVAIERLYYRVTRTPALVGRTHAYLTGLLLALTLPPFVPWYVPVIAAAFAIIVGKAIFGGVGHFLWQPALVGRFVVAVVIPAATINPAYWPVLAQNKLLTGDIVRTRRARNFESWAGRPAPQGADAFAIERPETILSGLTAGDEPQYSGIVGMPADVPAAKPAALLECQPINELFYGAHPGGTGETCAMVLIVAILYLVYRNYAKWQLPLAFLLSAAAVVAVAPVRLAGAGGATRTVWMPLLAEGLDVGFTYVNYQLVSGELMLAAFLLSAEMTTRPITTGGQVVFAVATGVLAMILRLYVDLSIPCYAAILAMNTFVPAIDRLWPRRVLGRGWLDFLRPGQ